MDERRGRVRWRCFLGFCGNSWSTSGRRHPTNNNSELSEPSMEEHRRDTEETSSTTDLGCLLGLTPNGFPVAEVMNLAAALAAERHYRAAEAEAETETADNPPGTPLRVSLMRLLVEGEEEEKREGVLVVAGGGGVDCCCVCMGRRKGSAFIPCGHTFCRVCARELWLNRGACPLCNGAILEILDIF